MSSHTMGPVVTAARLLELMQASPYFFDGLKVRFHVSLAFTGAGYGSYRATILGLAGFDPENYDPDEAETALAVIHATHIITATDLSPLNFDPKLD